jgi:Zn-dependent protease
MQPSNIEIAVYMLVGLIIGVIFHEFMHGYVAYRMGDTTAKRAGRLTLDPLAHIDPFGTLILPGILFLLTVLGYGGFIFGYAKPVPINPFLFKKRRGIIYVSLAGPSTNLAIAIIFFGLLKVFSLQAPSTFIVRAINTCYYIALINLVLFVFNLIPIPPLDGSRILGYFLKGDAQRMFQSIEPYGFMIILFLVFFFGVIITGPVDALRQLIFRLFRI